MPHPRATTGPRTFCPPTWLYSVAVPVPYVALTPRVPTPHHRAPARTRARCRPLLGCTPGLCRTSHYPPGFPHRRTGLPYARPPSRTLRPPSWLYSGAVPLRSTPDSPHHNTMHPPIPAHLAAPLLAVLRRRAQLHLELTAAGRRHGAQQRVESGPTGIRRKTQFEIEFKLAVRANRRASERGEAAGQCGSVRSGL